jgi:DNA repair photolyase
MNLDDLIARIDPRFRPVWLGRPKEEQVALARYFLPHHSMRNLLAPTRPRLMKWYCPFAAQSVFPTGHRYCINVYSGCSHGCLYCYAATYSRPQATAKRHFANLLKKDLADLEEKPPVPPAPLHVSNSTDPFQPLERGFGHTRLVLQAILKHRNRFTTVTILTKNPLLAAESDYRDLLLALNEVAANHPWRNRWPTPGKPACQVEVNLAFWREEAAAFWDPHAPTVADRVAGIRALRQAGVAVVLRIDPLFPRSPLPARARQSLSDFGLVEAHTRDVLAHLVAFAKEVRVLRVVFSPAKIVRSRDAGLADPMRRLRDVYAHMTAPEKLVWRGGSWRLPQAVSDRYIVAPLLEICRCEGVPAKFCMCNLLETE